MKKMTLALAILFYGCGYGTNQTRITSGPNGSRVTHNSRCFGSSCGAASYGERGLWLESHSPYPYSAAEGRLGLIEAYRARNHWVRSNSPSPSNTESDSDGRSGRDSRLDRLVPYIRHMAHAMCENGVLHGEDCAPPERSASERNGQ